MKYTFLLLLLPCIISAQTFTGIVINRITQEPIPYVNIGVVGQNMGTVSNEEGQFDLKLGELIQERNVIQFSIVGYESQSWTVEEFSDFCKKDCSVALEEQTYDLSEVIVIPKDYVTLVVGNPNTKKELEVGYEDNKLGYEVGIRMKIKKRPTQVESVTLHIARCEYDSVFYRLNIYDMKGKRVGDNLLKAPIYLNYTKEDIKDRIVVDLLPYNIYVEDDFLVSMELVNDLGRKGLYFGAGIFNNKSYYRKTSQGTWSSIPVGVGISAKVRQEKK